MSEILIDHVIKLYEGKKGIDNVNLVLPNGKLTAIVGPSGCGKTTLLRTIAGFNFPDAGRVVFGKCDVTHLTPQKRNVSMVFQQYALWPHMSVFDNIAYGLKLKRFSNQEIDTKVMDILRKVELDTSDVRKRKPQQYSGGQQQRIVLARSLVIQPDVLLMDEPLSNLDAKVRVRLRLEIKQIQEKFGVTTIYVTHDQEEALSMADYIVVMNDGKVEQASTPADLYQNPQSLFAAKFLGESHMLKSRENGVERTYVIRSRDAQLLMAGDTLPKQGLVRPAVVRKHLYMGSYCRYMVEVDGSELFVDDVAQYPDNMVGYLYVPQKNLHIF